MSRRRIVAAAQTEAEDEAGVALGLSLQLRSSGTLVSCMLL
jgi:hypothetical protein